mmetsp:Transcript_10779/g.23171  ORF Transcript_10779/g.23171 Transcript_10779/m.23171 type:complete len:456 (+) Transcript_10779:58-1425(+)|eukprot:CAMPEP_0202922780 /NCGR_PEP_ID=MMETSP1392-20130828/78102_1 /ASSEMBLY_ACC=CAM_ASM_000868 /TAXON_ID=225041 /ORGANISM="Chlamydomonas chlamydogama, Strain SAG 11-48b" /LENGTH=455 /DNA_ID=CAMNT_0049616425 /DNA_START=39 /DNA_END=1406 /DNA_ORIENTATION=+
MRGFSLALLGSGLRPGFRSLSSNAIKPQRLQVVKVLAAKRVLVLNAGSSSLKFKVFNASEDNASLQGTLGGVVERIGDISQSGLVAKGISKEGEKKKWELKVPAKDHVSAMQTILRFLKENDSANFAREVAAVGHRVVHGGSISQPLEVTEQVIKKIEDAAVLAPLHNPPALQGINAAREVFTGVPNVVVVDTAFHQTIPPHAYMYAIPYDLYEKHAIRKYGFHGTSHQYLVGQAAAMLGKPVDQVNAITCHLGAGSSIACVQGGKCIDTSMGMTPLDGLMMATRCGEVDPAVVLHLQDELKLSTKETDTLLNKKSGLLGLCGQSDVRSVIELRDQGDPHATLALDMFVYRVRKFIGAYSAALGGKVDALVFSAGIGENSTVIRNMVCQGLEGMGIEVDEALNSATVGGRQADISVPGSRVRVLVVPTDEELSIAQQTMAVVAKGAVARQPVGAQ